MSEQVTPTVKEQAPETSVLELKQESDAQFLERLGLAPKPEEAPKEPVKEEKPKVEEEPIKKVPVPTEPVEEPEAEPEEEEAEPEEEPKAKVTYDFKVADDEGELEVPDDLKITFTANGKVRENVPLEKLVKFAQMGVYNHEREQTIKQSIDAAQETVKDKERLQGMLDDALVRVRMMLTDENYYTQIKEQYELYNTPENRAARAEQEARQARDQVVFEREAGAVAAATRDNLAPAIEGLLRDNPLVPEYEIMGRFNSLVAPLLVNGRLPAGRLNHVFHIVQNDLAHWVQGVQMDRADAETEKAKELERERKKTIAAKRQVARKVKPEGGPGPEKSTEKEPESAKDWFSSRFDPKE